MKLRLPDMVRVYGENWSKDFDCKYTGGKAFHVDFDDVEEKVRGREDTRKALELLVNKDLAYCHKERYYPCVSGRTARVLENVAAEKAHMETRNRILKKEMDISALLEMFRVLFEDA